MGANRRDCMVAVDWRTVVAATLVTSAIVLVIVAVVVLLTVGL